MLIVTFITKQCRALHEKERRPKGGTTRTQFFLLVLISSFAYYIVPGYFFFMITAFSWVCWLAPKSLLAQQLGSGLQGLGIGSFGIDWSTISSYLGSPLASPWFASANVAVGFVLVMYVMTPIVYWNNIYKANTFPIFSSSLFMANGTKYDILSIIDSKFHLDRGVYAHMGSVHMSSFFAMTYGLGFATLTATLVHVLLFNGRYAYDIILNFLLRYCNTSDIKLENIFTALAIKLIYSILCLSHHKETMFLAIINHNVC